MASALSSINYRDRSDTPTVVNNAGGDTVYAVTPLTRLRRFLILGTEGGTYYQSQRELTEENARVVIDFAKSDPRTLVDELVAISLAGRAPKNDQALFALAAAASLAPTSEDRNYALAHLNQVARTGTHLFQFVGFAQQFRGWGRALKRAVANWYTSKDPDKLAYQLVKYRQRDGWKHSDVLRLSHPVPPTGEHDAAFRFALGRPQSDWAHVQQPHSSWASAPRALFDFTLAQEGTGLYEVARDGYVPWEAFRTEDLNDPRLWGELLEANAVPYTALLRQLPRLTRIGLLDDPAARAQVVGRLTDSVVIGASRIHPLNLLNAQRTYAAGYSQRGSSVWTPNRNVVDALDKAFYKSFGNVRATGKRILLALDVSGSMTSPINGMMLTAREASAAMALATLSVEPDVDVVGFTAPYGLGWNGRTGLTSLDLSPRRRLDDNIRAISDLPFGGTDCSLPMRWAEQNGKYDAFVVYTDSETNYGAASPADSLRRYRRTSGVHDAKLVVAALTSSGFSIADPNDQGMLDVVGCDSNLPNIITGFINGEI